ncbi:Carbonyl reductase [NADPH] 3 [Armadillidium vulgare]|nr:Carbonyl reductase [NADPH] 3 [Armadillidium vulgare]
MDKISLFYNISIKEYSNRDVVQKIWENIAKELKSTEVPTLTSHHPIPLLHYFQFRVAIAGGIVTPGIRKYLVTGSNKGIGFAIVKDLCKKFDGLVYLTSRDESRGKAAVEILQKKSRTEPYPVQARKTLKINYFDTKNFCNAIFPLLKPHGRVVNVSSSAGHLSRINGQEPQASNLRNKLASPLLTEKDLDELMNDYIRYIYV